MQTNPIKRLFPFGIVCVLAMALLHSAYGFAHDRVFPAAVTPSVGRDDFARGANEVIQELQQIDPFKGSTQAGHFASEVENLQYKRLIEGQFAANEAQVQAPAEKSSATPQIPPGKSYELVARAVLIEADKAQSMGNRYQ